MRIGRFRKWWDNSVETVIKLRERVFTIKRLRAYSAPNLNNLRA